MEYMDKYPLLAAARDGDVDFLIESLNTHQAPPDYFLTRSITADGEDEFNMIHVAIIKKQTEFLNQALQILPTSTVHTLLRHKVLLPALRGFNAFHIAAANGYLTIVRLLVEYARLSYPATTLSSSKPWLMMADKDGDTPLQLALEVKREECALELMSLDMELLCNMENYGGNSPLYTAVYHGFERVAVTILTSGHTYSTSGINDLSPLDVVPFCTEEVCRLLLQNHPHMIRKLDGKGTPMLHKWVESRKVWPFEFMLNRDITAMWRDDFLDLVCMKDKDLGDNPLHVAAYHCCEETVQITRLLVEAFADKQVLMSPWKQKNNKHSTPPHMALVRKHERLALYYINLDFDEIVIASNKNFLYAAVESGCEQAAETILATLLGHPCFVIVDQKSFQGRNILHAASNCSEATSTLLVEKLPWMIKEADDNGKTPLDVASELGTAWLIKLLLKKEPSCYKDAAWIEACQNGHIDAIKAFIEYAPDFRRQCIEAQDSPLHHIKLGNYSQYQEFIAIPFIRECLNMQDYDKATPLHRALERKDILLADVLLSTRVVSNTIQDNNGYTANYLLAELCDQHGDWVEMCQRVGINPRLITPFIRWPNRGGEGIQREYNASSTGEIRGTLSVVAALLATLTFAAGFTLPGGLNQETGEALLAKKASFVVFILADTYAMCCSMLVLFFLMWSMVVDDQDRSLILVDRSVLILIQSLYGTLVAFMTGVFTVISPKSLWASIVVFFMCSFIALVAISPNSAFLHKFLDKLAPSSGIRRRRNQTRSLEEGRASTSRNGDTYQKSE